MSGAEHGSIHAAALALLVAIASAAHAGVADWQAHANKGVAAFERGDYGAAAVSLSAAVKEAERFADADPRLPLTLNILGSQYLSRGDHAKAEPLLKRSLEIRKKALGGEHPDVARSSNNLGMLYAVQGKYDMAAPLLADALAIWEKTLGPAHPDVANSLNNLGMLHKAQGSHFKAESLFKRAREIWEKAGDSSNAAMALRNMSLLYAEMGKTNEAEDALRQSATILARKKDGQKTSSDVSHSVKVILPR